MILFDLPREFVLGSLFVLGCCIGSFLNVCIHRFPSRPRLVDQLRALNSHRSGCPRCAAAIRWRDNIPLLGWLLLGGRCRSCRRPISIRYPLVEFLTGCLFAVVYWCEMPPEHLRQVTESGLYSPLGPQMIEGHWRLDVWLHIRYALHMLLICGLVVATFIDAEHRIIPDGCTIPVLVVAVLTSWLVGQVFIVPLWFQGLSEVRTVQPSAPEWLRPLLFYWDSREFVRQAPHVHGLLVSVAGVVAGGGAIWIVRIVGFWVLRQEAMGFGDVVLMAAVGSVIGWQPVLVVFFLAPLFAVLAAGLVWFLSRGREIPYGPWLSLATLVVLLGWSRIWPVAEPVFDLGPILMLMGVLMIVSLVVSLQLIQVIKRLLGISTTAETLVAEEWTSADHLSYYNSERPDPQTGLWRQRMWPGIRAGQGSRRLDAWRHPDDHR